VSRFVPPGKDTVKILASSTFAARQLYETLLRLDCSGQLRPGLAVSWHAEDRGASWVLTLRPNARFWDGTRVTPAGIASAWSPDSTAGTPVRSAGILQVAPAGDRDIRLTLAQPRESLPSALADPALAVVRHDERDSVGSGRYRPAAGGGPPTLLAPADSSTHGVIKLLAAGGDPRDAVDGGAEVVVTDDPATLRYVEARPDFSAVPLPWSRTYLLAIPNRPGVRLDTASTARVRETLAHDVVRVDARAAEPPFSWQSCAGPLPARTPAAEPTAPRIAYPAGDPTARDLAARIVAIGGAPARSIVGLEPKALRESLRQASDAAYLVAVPRAPLIPCAEPVPWTADVTIVPLVDTREHVILRRGAPPLTVDWDGTLRLVPELP